MADIQDTANEIQQMIADSIPAMKLRHLLEQLRGEFGHGFVAKRNGPYPAFPNHEQHVRLLSDLKGTADMTEIKKFKSQVISMVINYIALDVFQGYYPKGDLSTQVRAKVIKGKLMVQYCPSQCSRYDQSVPELFENLFTVLEVPLREQSQITSCKTINQLVRKYFKIENVMHDLQDGDIEISTIRTLAELTTNNLSHIIVFNNQVVTKRQLLQMKKFDENGTFDEVLQGLLADCIINLTAPSATSHLPKVLNNFVRYQNPEPLPKEFLAKLPNSNQESARKLLRLVLGIYPEDIEQVLNIMRTPKVDEQGEEIAGEFEPDETCDPISINCESLKKECGKLWIDQRIQQMTYILLSIEQGGDKIVFNKASLTVPENCTREALLKFFE